MKKKYYKPELVSVKIDNTITLVMYSNEDAPPDPDPFATGGAGAPANSGQFKESF
jgi:hypothetical protein